MLSVAERARFLLIAIERRLIVAGYEAPSHRATTVEVLERLISTDDRSKLLKSLSADAARPVHSAIAAEIVHQVLSGQLPQFSVCLQLALAQLAAEDASLIGKYESETLPALQEVASDAQKIFEGQSTDVLYDDGTEGRRREEESAIRSGTFRRKAEQRKRPADEIAVVLDEKFRAIGKRLSRGKRGRQSYEIVATDQMRRMMREGLSDADWIGALTLGRLPRGHTRIVKKFLTRSTAVIRAHLAMIEYTEEGLSEEILSAAAEKLQKRIRFRVRKGMRANLAHCGPSDWSSKTLKAMANSAVNRYRQRAVRSQ